MPETYEIVIEGQLDRCWEAWLGEMAFTYLPGGRTRLSGALPDPAALYGLLERLRDLNLALISVNRCSTPAEEGE